MKSIGKMKLQNFGGFITRLMFEYYDEDKNIGIQTKMEEVTHFEPLPPCARTVIY